MPAPLVAAGGLVVPGISGRGLAHTCGTLDKLVDPRFFCPSIAGRILRGLVALLWLHDQPAGEIAPADRNPTLCETFEHGRQPIVDLRFYHDQKLAEGIDGLVFDVKTGPGAFMQHAENAIHPAGLMVETAKRMSVEATALITDMDQPLGLQIGNALEEEEALAVLRGDWPGGLRTLCLELAAPGVLSGAKAASVNHARQLSQDLLASGAALLPHSVLGELASSGK